VQSRDVPPNFNYLGDANTSPTAINASGEIVGTYNDAFGVVHGFFRDSAGLFTGFDAPNPAIYGTTTPGDK
jgi:hypothetical protein